YANGDAVPDNRYPYKVAWARSAEWNGSPGPDDSYIGGAVSKTDLTGMFDGSACQHRSPGETPMDGCVMRLRFKLPPPPNTPCPPPFNACGLTGSEAMRYQSLTFWYQAA